MKRIHQISLSLAATLVLGACATGAHSPSARPVLYPNAKYNQVGETKARSEVDVCISKAQQAGLTPDDKNNSVATGAARGAATAGVAAAVGTLISGQNIDHAARNAAGAAAVGASAGAVNGSFNDRANPTYRRFIERCMSEKGFEIIGWN